MAGEFDYSYNRCIHDIVRNMSNHVLTIGSPSLDHHVDDCTLHIVEDEAISMLNQIRDHLELSVLYDE